MLFYPFSSVIAAQNQNITVGVSFGAMRELAFLHSATGNKIYFPQVSLTQPDLTHDRHSVNVATTIADERHDVQLRQRR